MNLLVKTEFFKHISFTLGNGEGVRFWEDTWLGQQPLSEQYPSLYNIVRFKNVLVANVFQNGHVNIPFRRSLVGDKWNDWLNLVERLMPISLTIEPDSITWNLTPSGVFSVKSLYLEQMNSPARFYKKYIWKLKVPLKIKIFMWFLHRKVLLTKDNLIKRHWTDRKSTRLNSSHAQ